MALTSNQQCQRTEGRIMHMKHVALFLLTNLWRQL